MSKSQTIYSATTFANPNPNPKWIGLSSPVALILCYGCLQAILTSFPHSLLSNLINQFSPLEQATIANPANLLIQAKNHFLGRPALLILLGVVHVYTLFWCWCPILLQLRERKLEQQKIPTAARPPSLRLVKIITWCLYIRMTHIFLLGFWFLISGQAWPILAASVFFVTVLCCNIFMTADAYLNGRKIFLRFLANKKNLNLKG